MPVLMTKFRNIFKFTIRKIGASDSFRSNVGNNSFSISEKSSRNSFFARPRSRNRKKTSVEYVVFSVHGYNVLHVQIDKRMQYAVWPIVCLGQQGENRRHFACFNKSFTRNPQFADDLLPTPAHLFDVYFHRFPCSSLPMKTNALLD